MRDTPYNDDEKRVCDYIRDITGDQAGCGDDPIGFLIASHSMLRIQLRAIDRLHTPAARAFIESFDDRIKDQPEEGRKP